MGKYFGVAGEFICYNTGSVHGFGAHVYINDIYWTISWTKLCILAITTSRGFPLCFFSVVSSSVKHSALTRCSRGRKGIFKKFPPKNCCTSWTHPTSFEWGQSTTQQWCQHRGLRRKNMKSDCKENPLCTEEIIKQTLDCTVYTFLHRSSTGCFSFRCDGKSTHILFALINIFGFTAAGCSDSGKAFTYAPWRQRGKWRRSPKRTSRLSSRRMPLCCLQSPQLL